LKSRQEKFLKDNVFIISSKDLLNSNEKFYENKLENAVNNKVLELLEQIMVKINNMESMMDNMEERISKVEKILEEKQ
jgi:hypothetical protein